MTPEEKQEEFKVFVNPTSVGTSENIVEEWSPHQLDGAACNRTG